MPITSKGRVVYERKTHLFTYKDVLRIIRKVDPATAPDEGAIQEAGAIAAAGIAVLEDMVRVFIGLDKDQVSTPDLEDAVLQLLVVLLRLLSYMPQLAGRFLQRVLDSIRDIDPMTIFRREQDG
jgi:hypothetical protein